MNLTQITTLLPPLQNAIALQSWEDVGDLAGEIRRLSRVWQMEEAQGSGDRRQESRGAQTASQAQSGPSRGADAIKEMKADLKEKMEAQRAAISDHFKEMKPYATPVGSNSGTCVRITLATRFDEQGHEETWRNSLAKELNSLLVSAKQCSSVKFWFVACSLAGRVAEFEQIKTV